MRLSRESKLDLLDFNPLCSVVIVHHQSDRKFAIKIYQALLEEKRDVWIDFMSEAPKKNRPAEIEQAIDGHDVVIFLLSPESNTGKVCLWMLDYALSHSKRVVPIYVKPVPAGDIYPDLVLLSWIFFPAHLPFEVSLALLKDALDQEPQHTQLHTKLLGEALSWRNVQEEKSFLLRQSDIAKADNWLLACYLGKEPQAAMVQLDYIKSSKAEASSISANKRIASLFGIMVAIGIAFPSWGVFFFSLIFSHVCVYFSSWPGPHARQS